MSRRKTRVTGVDARHAGFDAVDPAILLERLGVEIERDLLVLALTHRSFANENGMLPNNERLEFLGDAVLGLSVANRLYELYTSSPESDISKMRASIVSRYGLADIAREIGLGEFILLGKGELLTDGRSKESILADTTEALLGAIFRQHGFEVARDVVLRLFADKINHASAKGINQDWKTTLQEELAQRKKPMAEYVSTSEGPDHDLVFSAIVSLEGTEMGRGIGPNKKLAEQEAARQAFRKLKEKRARTA